MIPDLRSLLRAVLQTLRDPRAGARAVMDIDLPRSTRWELLFLVVLLNVVASVLTMLAGHVSGGVMLGEAVFGSPFMLLVVQGVLSVLMAVAIFQVGRMFGGHGTLDQAIMLVAWLQFVLITLQVAQMAALLVLPPLANLIGLASLLVTFYLLTMFVAEMHGFRSVGAVFVGIMGGTVLVLVVFSFMLALLGVQISGV